MSDVSADQIAATVQDYGHQLGRIEDLVQELDSLRLHCPALSSVTARNTCVSLVFLGLEAEIKFSVNIQIGESLQFTVFRPVVLDVFIAAGCAALFMCCIGYGLLPADFVHYVC